MNVTLKSLLKCIGCWEEACCCKEGVTLSSEQYGHEDATEMGEKQDELLLSVFAQATESL